MPPDDDPDRRLRARIAANTRWGHASAEDRARQGATAARGLLAKFEREVDPDGTLPADERARRAQSLMTAHMLRLSAASAAARRAKKGGLSR